jgi:hypothetical protein
MTLAPDLTVLPTAQRRLWPELTAVPSDFVLYGGTAIALRLGHRSSVDFDWFSAEAFDPFVLRARLGRLGEGRILQSEPNTLSLIVERQGDVKLSLFGGIAGRVGDPESTADGVLWVASALDLIGHKLKVILQRAEARDYQDIAALLRSGISLDTGLGAAAALFAPGFPVAESVKALGYFKDLTGAPSLVESDRKLLTSAIRGLPDNLPVIPLIARALRSPTP